MYKVKEKQYCTDLADHFRLVKIKRSKNGKEGNMIYRYSFPINPRQDIDPCIPPLQTQRPGHGLSDPEWLCASKYCNAGLWQHHLSLDTEQGSGNPAFTEICLKTKIVAVQF